MVLSDDGKTLVEWEHIQPTPQTAQDAYTAWNVRTGEQIAQWKDDHVSMNLVPSHDGRVVVSAGFSFSDGKRQGSQVRTFALPEGNVVSTAPLSGDLAELQLAVTADGGTAYVIAPSRGMFAVDTAFRSDGFRAPSVPRLSLRPLRSRPKCLIGFDQLPYLLGGRFQSAIKPPRKRFAIRLYQHLPPKAPEPDVPKKTLPEPQGPSPAPKTPSGIVDKLTDAAGSTSTRVKVGGDVTLDRISAADAPARFSSLLTSSKWK